MARWRTARPSSTAVLKTEADRFAARQGRASSMPTATRSTTSIIRKVAKRARRQVLERADHLLSERLAVLELRSGDLPKAAALFAQLPGHQEGLIRR